MTVYYVDVSACIGVSDIRYCTIVIANPRYPRQLQIRISNLNFSIYIYPCDISIYLIRLTN